MSDSKIPHLSKSPFWLTDAVLLIAAGIMVAFGSRPLRAWEMVTVTACAALGGWLAVLPYLKDYEAAVKLTETDRLAETTAKLGQLESLADRISGATGQWQAVQDRAQHTTEVAQGIVDHLTREAGALAASVSKTADTEKQTLKLEVDKLRRMEADWLQAVGRIMDHVFALHVAAVRSGQPAVKDQIDRFHAACRDALRRVGFSPVVATPDEPFDSRKHQVADGARPPDGARIDETVAPGFLFQGQLLRPVVVRVTDPAAASAGGTSESGAAQLPASKSEEGSSHSPETVAQSDVPAAPDRAA